jgi:phosphoglycolate phosphatase
VLTNKPTSPAKKILAHLGLAAFFTEVIGPDSVSPPFPRKPDGARLLIQRHGLAPRSTTLVGDGEDDMEAATECGFRFIAAAYGYGKAAESRLLTPLTTIKNISEIKQILL